MNFIGTIGALIFAFLGRWIQFHPEKLVLQGTFENPQSSGAIEYRKMIAVVGTFGVFAGVCGGIYSLSFWFDSGLLHLLLLLTGIFVGVLAARHVRREVREKYQPAPGQFSLWP